MIIKYEDYTLYSDNGRFNLYKSVEVEKKDSNKKPTGETHRIEKVIGYGFKLENAVKRIIDDIMESKDDKVSLRVFLIEYKRQIQALKELLTINI